MIKINSKIKKIGAIAIIVIIALASITFYENATDPQGISEVTNHITNFNYSSRSFLMQKSLNYTYLGNRISLVYHMAPGFSCHYLNISWSNRSGVDVGYCAFQSCLFLSNYSSIHSLYSNPVVTIQNTSVSINHPLYKNGTNKNDSFGPYGQYSIIDGTHISMYDLYLYGTQRGCLNDAIVPVYKAVNQGNFTFYENITFTITLSIGILHFTSQPYHLDESWWQAWEFNTGTRNLG
ncbi:MAG: hypothetical protein ACYCR7_03335 [Thermoplasmataceae archaeon]